MLYQKPLFISFKNLILLLNKFPQISLLIWLIPLLLFTSGETSLMAHDEALYARRSRLMFDSGDWIAPWETAHHKTPGFYWLVAISYQLFGVSDTTARIPAMIAGILCTLVIYEIAKILLSKKLAYLATVILSVEFLWLQYSRLVAPDVPTILLVCLGILSLLKAELNPKYRWFYGFIVGISFSLGFLMRSFMIFLPIVALFPYLIGEHRRHHHLTNPMLYLGGLVGLIPTFIWLWLNWLRYGGDSIGHLLGFVAELGSRERHGNGIIFYFWNIPLKSFPWFLFSLLGLGVVIRQPIKYYQLLLVGFPLVLLIEITIFSTRLSHYSLCLYPFIAMFAAVGLDWLGKIYQQIKIPNKPNNNTHNKVYLPRNISYGFGVLGIVCFLAGVVVLIGNFAVDQKYAILASISGLSCLIVPLIWIFRYHFGQKFLTARYWISGWLIAGWLSIATAGSLGLLGDFNPVFRMFFQQESISTVLKNNPVDFVNLEGKNAVLLNFYTPIHGQKIDSISQISALSYAWIYTPNSGNLAKNYRVIGSVKDYQLIQVLPPVKSGN
jgi:4-amino-4-deoxy-L-arabinose transferase-like glycosyltransferase